MLLNHAFMVSEKPQYEDSGISHTPSTYVTTMI